MTENKKQETKKATKFQPIEPITPITRVEEVIKEPVKKAKITQFVMIKNTAGGFSVELEPHDFSAPARRISFRHDQKRNYIPVKWAVGTFVSPSALRQMELGYFTFENLEALIEMAEEMGYYVPDSIKDPKLTLGEIARVIRKGDLNEMEKMTSLLTSKTRRDIIATAQKLYDNLSVSTVMFLEEKLQVILKPISLRD